MILRGLTRVRTPQGARRTYAMEIVAVAICAITSGPRPMHHVESQGQNGTSAHSPSNNFYITHTLVCNEHFSESKPKHVGGSGAPARPNRFDKQLPLHWLGGTDSVGVVSGRWVLGAWPASSLFYVDLYLMLGCGRWGCTHDGVSCD